MVRITRKFKRLEIELETDQTTTGNGPAVGGKVNNLLKVGKIGNGEKTNGLYVIKGLRGWINHAMMTYAKKNNIEVCHTSEKTETQKGESLLPEGFHPAGKCLENGECVKHRLMGSFKKKSKIRFEPVVIISTAYKGTIPEHVQQMHIATDKRNTLVQGSKAAIQDFGQRYFAGKFTLTIEFLEEVTKEELGFLLKAILYAPELGLGAAVNNGSGRVKILQVTLQQVERSRGFNGHGKVVEEEKTRNLWKEMQEAMDA